MVKMIFALIAISAALFTSSQSATFQCEYITGGWGTLGTIYYCSVQNAVSITSLDEAQIDDISGNHKSGNNNDNVVAFYVYSKGQIHYFPRGLDAFFKNLKGVHYYNIGLKEVHQSDLKAFPKLVNLYLHSNQLEILEENLFEFNPRLEYIYLSPNKISHIDPNVFNKLTKLTSLYLDSNTCINMKAEFNQNAVKNVIESAEAQCTNADYSNLEQKAKSLKIESKTLNLEKFKEKVENLENEIKNSKFLNFFQEKLQDLKATQIEKEKEENLYKILSMVNVETFSGLESKVDNITANLKDLITQDSNRFDSEQCAALKESFDEKFTKFDEKMSELSGTVLKMDESIANFKEVILNFHKETSTNVKDTSTESSKTKTEMSELGEKIEKCDIKLEIFEENLSNFKIFSYKKFDKMEIEEQVFRASIKKVMERSFEDIERKIGEIEAKNDRKFDEIYGKFEEMERKFELKLEEIVKNRE